MPEWIPVGLAILFIILKLTGVISWSWLWVLSPIWIPIALVFGFFIVAAIIFIVISLFALILTVITGR